MKPLVIGVGNPWRSDDGVGPRVVEALEAQGRDDVDLLVLDGEPARVVSAWQGRSLVVVVDAVRAGDAPGSIHRIDALAGDLPASGQASSHGAGIAEAVALARSLDRLPARLVVLGVEPGSLDHGADLSPAVAAMFGDLVRRTAEEASVACA